jgi:hypothetical protein
LKKSIWGLGAVVALAVGLLVVVQSAQAAGGPSNRCGARSVTPEYIVLTPTAKVGQWTFAETLAQGDYEFFPEGLRIYTESNTSRDKVAGYTPYSAKLGNVTNASFDYTSVLGSLPGLQIIVDLDNNPATYDGILVGESVYGDNWWITRQPATPPHTDVGFGSPWYGTLDEWVTSYPNADVLAVGFSLGSGASGDGVIDTMTFGCTTFSFGAKPGYGNGRS